MGLINILQGLAGYGGNARELIEVFRPNAEASDARGAEHARAALDQLGAEFTRAPRGRFDACVDGLNRLPRPLMVLAVFALFASAMTDPVWFGERMAGLALVPEPLWWLMGAIVSFYFGARHQVKGQEFQRSIAASVAMVPKVTEAVRELRTLDALTPGVADPGSDAAVQLAALDLSPSDNAALAEWGRAQ